MEQSNCMDIFASPVPHPNVSHKFERIRLFSEWKDVQGSPGQSCMDLIFAVGNRVHRELGGGRTEVGHRGPKASDCLLAVQHPQ